VRDSGRRSAERCVAIAQGGPIGVALELLTKEPDF
jgi:hypothetical protein